MSKAVQHLLEAALILSPTSEENHAFQMLVNRMTDAHESEKSICVALSGAINDGLRFDNWPKQNLRSSNREAK